MYDLCMFIHYLVLNLGSIIGVSVEIDYYYCYCISGCSLDVVLKYIRSIKTLSSNNIKNYSKVELRISNCQT
jgi:hypothetical protein